MPSISLVKLESVSHVKFSHLTAISHAKSTSGIGTVYVLSEIDFIRRINVADWNVLHVI